MIPFSIRWRFFVKLIETAMGTVFTPTYATLVMGYLECKLYICNHPNIVPSIASKQEGSNKDLKLLKDQNLKTC